MRFEFMIRIHKLINGTDPLVKVMKMVLNPVNDEVATFDACSAGITV
jgi:hypothetical protein